MFAKFRKYIGHTLQRLHVTWVWQWQMLVLAKWLVTHRVMMNHCQFYHPVAHCRKLSLVA